MLSLFKLVDTFVESSLALSLGMVTEVGPAAYFLFELLGGLIRSTGTLGEICGHCMILLPKYIDICNFYQRCRSNF